LRGPKEEGEEERPKRKQVESARAERWGRRKNNHAILARWEEAGREMVEGKGIFKGYQMVSRVGY